MTDSPSHDSQPKSRLEQISTRWSTLQDPLQFVTRYATAIRKYLDVLLRNPHDAEEVTQEILLLVVRQGFAGADPARGRFRDYLKRSVRNAALQRRRHKRTAQLGEAELARLAAADPAFPRAEQEWAAEWRECLLNRAWRALEEHQRQSPGNLAYTVLRLAVEYPDATSADLAERARRETGQPLTAAAFRKQLSRARGVFAGLVRAEVAQTLNDATREAVEEELAEVGLQIYLRRFQSE
jgi:RNA polymerase sigma-70 factor (ECF subfamily)